MNKTKCLTFACLINMCLCGCANDTKTLLELPEDIKQYYNYQIRTGETISFKYPSYFDLDESFDLKSFFADGLHEYDEYTLEGTNIDKLAFDPEIGYGTLTCLGSFEGEAKITGILKKTSREDTFIKFPCDLVVNYSNLSLNDECIFPKSFWGGTQNGNGPADMRQISLGWNPSQLTNEIYFYINPTTMGIEGVTISIKSLEIGFDKIKIENVGWCLYKLTPDNYDFKTFDYKALPAVLDSAREEDYTAILMKISFSDSITNNSTFVGGTVKFNVEMDGDSYSVYRDVYYMRRYY